MFVFGVGAVEEGALAAVVDADDRVHVDTVDDELFGDERVEVLVVGSYGPGRRHFLKFGIGSLVFGIELADDFVHGVADADVEHVVTDGERHRSCRRSD